MRIRRQQFFVAAISVAGLASMAAGQVSGTWTGMGDGRTYSDPANWSTFPNVPGGGGEIEIVTPYRSLTSGSLTTGIEISRWTNSGPHAARMNGASVTLVGPAVVSTNNGPLITGRGFQWTDIIFSAIHGTAGLTKQGSGALQLSGNNSFSGDVRIDGGWIVGLTNANFGALENVVRFNNGGLNLGGAGGIARNMIIESGGATIGFGAITPATIDFASTTTGAGPLFLRGWSSFTPRANVLNNLAHQGETSIIGVRTHLRASADASTHGRLSNTSRVTVVDTLELGVAGASNPNDLINDSATIAARGGSIIFNATSSTPEQVGTLVLESGRLRTLGAVQFAGIERMARSTWHISTGALPSVVNAPSLVGSGAPGSPTVGVLPYGTYGDSPPAPVTIDQGVIRPLAATEQHTLATLPSTDSPDANLFVQSGTIPAVSVRSLQIGSSVNGGTVTINGGGVYLRSSVSNPIDFGNQEGFIHSGFAETTLSPRLSGIITGSAGLTISGSVTMSALSTYTGETIVNGALEIRENTFVNTPSSVGASNDRIIVRGDGTSAGMLLIGRDDRPIRPITIDRPLVFISEGVRPSVLKAAASDATPSHVQVNSNIEIHGPMRFGGFASGVYSMTVAGAISGPGSVTIDANSGALVISGQNTYTGGTEIATSVSVAGNSPFGTGLLRFNSVASGVSQTFQAVNGPVVLNNPVECLGLGTLTFQGQHAIEFTSPIVSFGTATINVSGTVPVTARGGWQNAALGVSGTGTLELGSFRGSRLTANGGRVTFIAGENQTTSRTDNLVIAPAAVVDLNDHTLIIDGNTGSLTDAGVRDLLAAGRLISTAAVNDPRFAVGYARAGDVRLFDANTPAIPLLDQLIRSSDLIMTYTLRGDADLNGVVNLDDFTRLAAGFGLTDQVWATGDFNYDGTVSLDDFTALASQFGHSAPRGVPEPTSGFAVFLAAACVLRRNRE